MSAVLERNVSADDLTLRAVCAQYVKKLAPVNKFLLDVGTSAPELTLRNAELWTLDTLRQWNRTDQALFRRLVRVRREQLDLKDRLGEYDVFLAHAGENKNDYVSSMELARLQKSRSRFSDSIRFPLFTTSFANSNSKHFSIATTLIRAMHRTKTALIAVCLRVVRST